MLQLSVIRIKTTLRLAYVIGLVEDCGCHLTVAAEELAEFQNALRALYLGSMRFSFRCTNLCKSCTHNFSPNDFGASGKDSHILFACSSTWQTYSTLTLWLEQFFLVLLLFLSPSVCVNLGGYLPQYVLI